MNALEVECRDYVLGNLPVKSKAYSDDYLKRLENQLRKEWHEKNEQGFIEGKKVKHLPSWALTVEQAAIQSDDICDETFKLSHRKTVMKAIEEGKPVPILVLNELKE